MNAFVAIQDQLKNNRSISINILHSLYLSCLYEISVQNKKFNFFSLLDLEKYRILG